MDQAQKATMDAALDSTEERLTVEIPTEIQAGAAPVETIDMEPLEIVVPYRYNCKRR